METIKITSLSMLPMKICLLKPAMRRLQLLLPFLITKRKVSFVSALGYESRAQAIIDMAKELGVYIHKDPVLLNELKALKEGEQVPEQLFQIIAEILAFSYLLQGKTPESYVRADGTKAINTKA